ncbi:MAG: hypothetical protein Q4C13_03260 [Clostridia bacterium]|nr:hypothetical protein [Clostridia bacterium]
MTEHELYKTLIDTHLADRERIRANARRMPARRPAARRWLAAAACLVAALAVTALCIPSARAAVIAFFSDGFDPRDYLGQAPESRAEDPVPEIEALRQGGAACEGELEIQNEAGPVALTDGFDMRIEEAFTDGDRVWITGSFGGAEALYITEPWSGGTETKAPMSLAHWRLHTDGDRDAASYDPEDPAYQAYAETFLRCRTADGKSLSCLFDPVMADIEAVGGADMPAYLAEGGRIRFVAEISARGGALAGLADEEGRLALYFELAVGYCDCVPGDTPGRLFTMDFGPVEVDTSGRDAQARSHAFDNVSAALSGEAVMSRMHAGERGLRLTEERVSLDGVTIRLTELQLYPMGANLVLEYDLPDDWGLERTEAFLSHEGLCFELLINGESLMRDSLDYYPGNEKSCETLDEAARRYRVTWRELGIDPRSYAEIETLRLVPAIVYYTESAEESAPGSFRMDEHVQRFEGCAIEAVLHGQR